MTTKNKPFLTLQGQGAGTVTVASHSWNPARTDNIKIKIAVERITFVIFHKKYPH